MSAALREWVVIHHIFLVQLQGLLLAHRILQDALRRGDTAAAARDLLFAAELLRAAAAAMRLAKHIESVDYARDVRPSMEPPNVSRGFSGLWSADHAAVLQTMRRVGPLVSSTPALGPARDTYLRVLSQVYCVHADICSAFVGSGASLQMLTETDSTESGADKLLRNFRLRALEYAGAEGVSDDHRS